MGGECKQFSNIAFNFEYIGLLINTSVLGHVFATLTRNMFGLRSLVKRFR